MGHGQALVHGQPLDLVEDRGVGGIQLVGAEHTARAGDVDRHFAGEHGAHLHRRGVRAQHLAGALRCDVEGVLQGAGRVVRDEVQGVEVEVLRLDLRAIGDFPPHADEDVRDLLVEDRDRVLGANLAAGRWLGDVDALGAQRFLVALLLELGFDLGKELLNATACHVDDATGVLALILRQRAEGAASGRDRSVVTEVRATGLSEFLEVRRGGKGLFGGFGRRPHRLFRDFYSSLRRHWRFRQRGLLATRKTTISGYSLAICALEDS